MAPTLIASPAIALNKRTHDYQIWEPTEIPLKYNYSFIKAERDRKSEREEKNLIIDRLVPLNILLILDYTSYQTLHSHAVLLG